MSALVVSMSSINASFGGEFNTTGSQDDDEERTEPERYQSSLPTNASPEHGPSHSERWRCRYSLDDCKDDNDDEDEDVALVNVQSHDSTEESYVVVEQSHLPPTGSDDLTDVGSIASIPDMDMTMGDEFQEPVVVESSPHEPGPYLPYGGLENLGNTCYLNSALQMLASLDIFSTKLDESAPVNCDSSLRTEILDILHHLQRGQTIKPVAFKAQVDERSPLFIGYRQQDAHEFLTTLLDLLDEDYKKVIMDDQEVNDVDADDMKDGGTDEMKGGDADGNSEIQGEGVTPVKKQRLDAIQPEAEAIAPVAMPSLPTSGSFMELQFHDIETLLHGDKAHPATAATPSGSRGQVPKCKLIGGRMNTTGVQLTRWGDDDNDLAASADIKCVSEDGNTSEVSPDTKPYSPIDEIFTTEVRVCLTCDSCKYRRSHTETYLHLSLEIGPPIGSIEEGIRVFFKPEKRDVKCEKCFCETASQITEITKLPRAMLFHLKRFIVDISQDYSNVSYRKDQSAVAFAPFLEVDEHTGVLGEVVATNEVDLPQNARYCIRSVVNHIGSSASCGHYTADAFRQGEWIRFNDDYVTKISESTAVENAGSTAYMVLYELETVE
jgi:ubiquitin C-terminal hydrolase